MRNSRYIEESKSICPTDCDTLKTSHNDQVYINRSISTSIDEFDYSSSYHTALGVQMSSRDETMDDLESCFSKIKCCSDIRKSGNHTSAVEFANYDNGIKESSNNPHFEIIWTNISYVIPEPRSICSRLTEISNSMNSCIATLCTSTNSFTNVPAKVILQNVCGSFKSGQLTAIVGASETGKTALIKCLSLCQIDGYSGQISTSYPIGRKLKISYITEETEGVMGALTVEESLNFNFSLKNPCLSSNDNEDIVKIVSLLDLEVCLHTKIFHLTSWEKKRLQIAQELLSNSDIFIMDLSLNSPDSSKTIILLKDIINLFRRQFSKHIAIVVSIPQSHIDKFNMFDKVYCLAKGGFEIYDGCPKDCQRYLEQFTGIKMPLNDIPASFLIDFSSCEYGIKMIEKLNQFAKIRFVFKTKNRPLISRSITEENYVYKQDSYRRTTNYHQTLGIAMNINDKFNYNNYLSTSLVCNTCMQVDELLTRDTPPNRRKVLTRARMLIKRLWLSDRNHPVVL